MKISTHILDLSTGRPAANVLVVLHRRDETWRALNRHRTDPNGRITNLFGIDTPPLSGRYRLRFHTGRYYRSMGVESLHPFVEVVFDMRDAKEHHHIPLLITPHSYTTYRGS